MRSKQFLLILCVMTLGGPNTVAAKSSELNFSRVVVVYRTKLRNSSPLRQRQLMKATEQNEDAVFRSISPQRATARKTLWIANATVASVSPDALRELASNPNVAAIYPARRLARLIPGMSADAGRPNRWTYGLEKIGLVPVWSSHPHLDGSGIRIGVIDTGIAPFHPDLAGRMVAFRNFISPQNQQPFDDHGHGTHVAGTIAGGRSQGIAIGVAPAAELIVAKAFNRYGNSENEHLLEALQWMVDPDGKPETQDQVDIVSNSWNVDDEIDQVDPELNPFCISVKNLDQLGVAMVFAAGNDGPQANTIKVPAACPDAITVAASDEQDRIARFSSRGPVQWKNVTVAKPDITAPGVAIVSADYEGGHVSKSGTSMAAPHIAGALALLKQASPQASVADLRLKLEKGADPLGPSPVWGAGRANVGKSL